MNERKHLTRLLCWFWQHRIKTKSKKLLLVDFFKEKTKMRGRAIPSFDFTEDKQTQWMCFLPHLSSSELVDRFSLREIFSSTAETWSFSSFFLLSSRRVNLVLFTSSEKKFFPPYTDHPPYQLPTVLLSVSVSNPNRNEDARGKFYVWFWFFLSHFPSSNGKF